MITNTMTILRMVGSEKQSWLVYVSMYVLGVGGEGREVGNVQMYLLPTIGSSWIRDTPRALQVGISRQCPNIKQFCRATDWDLQLINNLIVNYSHSLP